MKHIKIRRFTVLALCAAMLSASIQTVAASEEKTLLPADEHETAAALSEINILRGDGVSFNLDQIPDRLQASVMVVRMRGEEEEALAAYAAGETTNPFSDVPEDWAQPYVAWLYAKGIALGVGDGRFGRTDCTPEMYATFMLRALGYSDTAASPDFSYDTSVAYAKEKGICTAAMETDVFDRGTMASMTYLTLAADVAGDDTSLLSALIDDGAVKREDAKHLLEAFGETADAALPHVDLYGETVTVLTESDLVYDFLGHEGGDTVDTALLARRCTAEDACNMILETISLDRDSFCRNVTNSVMAAEPMYDILLGSVGVNLSFAGVGILRDLNTVEGIELSNPRWDAEINGDLSLGTRQFMASGDVLLSDDLSYAALLYSPAVITELYGSDPAYKVREGTWTIEAFYQVCAAAEAAEKTAVLSDYDFLKKFYNGIGGSIVGKTDQNTLTVAVAKEYQFAADVLSRFGRIPAIEIRGTEDDPYNYEFAVQALSEGSAVFACDSLARLITDGVPHGGLSVLPMPKYDAAQADYRSTADLDVMRVLSLPQTCKYDEIGTVIEILGQSSSGLVDALLQKYEKENETGMLDLILDTGTVDLTAVSNQIPALLRQMTDTPNNAAIILVKQEKALGKQLEKFNNAIAAYMN